MNVRCLKEYLNIFIRKYTPHIQIENNIVINKQQIKYLGVVLQEKFTFKIHFDYIFKKAKNVFFAYSNLIVRGFEPQCGGRLSSLTC